MRRWGKSRDVRRSGGFREYYRPTLANLPYVYARARLMLIVCLVGQRTSRKGELNLDGDG